MTTLKVDTNQQTNFERLAEALPATGIAQALLKAWLDGDKSSRVARLVDVVQPKPIEGAPENDTPKD